MNVEMAIEHSQLDDQTERAGDISLRPQEPPIVHRVRLRHIMAEHPDVVKLIKPNPWTFAIILGLAAAQITLSWALIDSAWWVILLMAFVVGAVINHTLFVAIHECTHRLVFKTLAGNRAAGILANLVLVFPNSILFERHHLKHHTYLGVKDFDGDLPADWEIRLFSDTVLGRAVWIALMPIWQTVRPLGPQDLREFDFWLAFNFVAVLAFDVVIFALWGWPALLYLTLSTIFSIGGLHPMSARWIQEHFLIDDTGHETFSYYGIANYFDLNMGYHNEHHDFASVPWNNLPKLKRLAPEFYDGLTQHHSYSKLLFDFVVRGEPGMTARLVRHRTVT